MSNPVYRTPNEKAYKVVHKINVKPVTNEVRLKQEPKKPQLTFDPPTNIQSIGSGTR